MRASLSSGRTASSAKGTASGPLRLVEELRTLVLIPTGWLAARAVLLLEVRLMKVYCDEAVPETEMRAEARARAGAPSTGPPELLASAAAGAAGASASVPPPKVAVEGTELSVVGGDEAAAPGAAAAAIRGGGIGSDPRGEDIRPQSTAIKPKLTRSYG